MNILESIVRERREDVAAAKRKYAVAALQAEAAKRVHHSLAESLHGQGTRIIAEMKRASPSAGFLRTVYVPGELAHVYEVHGAAGISVLTEPHHFFGSPGHLRAVRAVTDLPVLRKDFLCDPYQVVEAAAWGADVILLIVAILDDALMQDLYQTARDLQLDVLVESHDAPELQRALALPEAIIGINSRNLKTLATNLDTARTLAREIPADRLSVAESGIRQRREIEELEALGYDGFLVGEALMREGDPSGRLDRFCGKVS